MSTKIAVIGCGHVGVVTAAGLAALGHDVTGVDVDAARVEALAAGEVPFWEPDLPALLRRTAAAGSLRFTVDLEAALPGAGAVFLCVNTPGLPSGAADMRHVRRAVTDIAAVLARSGGRPLIVNKSTAPIGTAETIEGIFRRAFGAACAAIPPLVANPEFLRQGSAVHDFFHPARIVVGADDAGDARRLLRLYDGIDAPAVQTTVRAAELIKYVANAFLATRVAFINEVAGLCESLGVAVDDVVDGVTRDPRIGSAMFRPGIGYGGSCLPKDVAALLHTAECVGVPLRILGAVGPANEAQKKHAANALRAHLGSLDGRTIAVWGATFKAGTDDLRDSPALDVLALLRNEGAHTRVYDPALAAPLPPALAGETCRAALDAVEDADALAVLCDWPEFAAVPPAEVAQLMRGRFVFDGRNVLDRAAVLDAGLIYRGVGRAGEGMAA